MPWQPRSRAGISTRSRPLTPGEIRIARSVFGDAIDLAPVTIRHARWWIFQPRNITMAPDGHIWFHPKSDRWREDFSTAALGLRGLFVHELVHVWQRQQGVNLILERPPFARYRYTYKPGRPFRRYGLEQQAELVRHAYLIREGARLPDKPPLATLAELIPFWPKPAGPLVA